VTTVCLPSCDYALDTKTQTMEQFNLINYCIRACFSLHCKLFQCIWTIYTARPSNGKHGKNAVLL